METVGMLTGDMTVTAFDPDSKRAGTIEIRFRNYPLSADAIKRLESVSNLLVKFMERGE